MRKGRSVDLENFVSINVEGTLKCIDAATLELEGVSRSVDLGNFDPKGLPTVGTMYFCAANLELPSPKLFLFSDCSPGAKAIC